MVYNGYIPVYRPKAGHALMNSIAKQRPYSLKALQHELERRLRPAPAPAMATLKKWSAAGMLKGFNLLTAAEAVESAIRGGRLSLRGPRVSTHSGGPEDAGPEEAPSPPKARQIQIENLDRLGCGPAPDPMAPATLNEMLLQNHAILSRLQESVQATAEAVQTLKSGAHQGSAIASCDETLIHAINQLESTRKHLLIQWDAYRQTLIADAQRQTGGSGQGSVSAGGPDILDWQRIQGKLTRIEQTLERIETSLTLPPKKRTPC